LGVGLSLAKRLVEMHDGTIEVRSEGPGHGSEFVVRLPIRGAIPAIESPEEAFDSDLVAALRVLVVDDNRDAAESLGMLLQMMGHEVREAHDGLEAVDVAAAFLPHVILLDIGLPKLNGYDAARRIRALSTANKPVLIALTGWGQESDRHQSYAAGFDHHLVKPVDPADLMRLLASVASQIAPPAAPVRSPAPRLSAVAENRTVA
jgi:CheY-like chemotaxis protein